MYKLKLHSCGNIIFFNKDKIDFFNRLNFTIDFFIAALLFQLLKKIYADTNENITQLTFTCSKLAIEAQEEGLKYVQS